MKSFDNENLNNREHIVFNLTHRWECLVEDQQEEEFDYAFFRPLAVDTFRLLFPLHDGVSDIPRDVVGILLLMKEFASFPIAISEKCDIAQLIAEALCSQVAFGWLTIDEELSEDQFVFETYNGYCAIDTATFDFSTIVEV